MLAPLQDPTYEPIHKPVNGQVPPVVLKWGKNSQIRWYRRFWRALRDVPKDMWSDSEHHQGLCCSSCEDELLDGWQGGGVMADGWCCCRDSRL